MAGSLPSGLDAGLASDSPATFGLVVTAFDVAAGSGPVPGFFAAGAGLGAAAGVDVDAAVFGGVFAGTLAFGAEAVLDASAAGAAAAFLGAGFAAEVFRGLVDAAVFLVGADLLFVLTVLASSVWGEGFAGLSDRLFLIGFSASLFTPSFARVRFGSAPTFDAPFAPWPCGFSPSAGSLTVTDSPATAEFLMSAEGSFGGSDLTVPGVFWAAASISEEVITLRLGDTVCDVDGEPTGDRIETDFSPSVFFADVATGLALAEGLRADFPEVFCLEPAIALPS